MQFWTRARWWIAWIAVVGVLFNTCASHREQKDTAAVLASGAWTPSVALALRGIRAAHSDDGDTNRYLAYANAVLGRPYQGFYVRPLEAWTVDYTQMFAGRDVDDPGQTPPISPSHPLVPYRDFLVEYPPGFFLLSIPVALLVQNLDAYRIGFSLLMAGLLSAALFLCVRMAKRVAPERTKSVVPWATCMAFALGTILVRRYDPVVSLSFCLLAWGCIARRPVAAGLGLGVGVATKLLPVLVAPLALVFWLSRRRSRDALIATAAATGAAVLITLPLAIAAGPRILDLFTYHGQRPLQVESTSGAILIVSRLFNPAWTSFSQSYGSANVVASWDAPFRWLAAVLPPLSLVLVCYWAWIRLRHESDEQQAARVLLRAMMATLIGWIALGKVFSPQYLTWLLPIAVLVSLFEPRSSRWKLLAILALTQVIYPFAYAVELANSLNPLFGVLVLVRNGLLLAWGTSLLRSAPAATDRTVSDERGERSPQPSQAAS